jgi:hypothetical protein
MASGNKNSINNLSQEELSKAKEIGGAKTSEEEKSVEFQDSSLGEEKRVEFQDDSIFGSAAEESSVQFGSAREESSVQIQDNSLPGFKQSAESNINNSGVDNNPNNPDNQEVEFYDSDNDKIHELENTIGNTEIKIGGSNPRQTSVVEEIEKIGEVMLKNNDSSLDRVKTDINKENTPGNKQELASSISEFKNNLKSSENISRADKENINKKLSGVEQSLGINQEKNKGIS